MAGAITPERVFARDEIMKLKGIFSALSLATLMALGGCGGGGGEDSGGSAQALFNIQGQRTLDAQEGGSIAVTATAVSQASASGLSGRWIVAGGTTLNESSAAGPGRFAIRNADCAENAQSGTGTNADRLPTVGRFTCTVFLEFPAISNPQEKVNLTFQSADPAGNSGSANFSVNVFRVSQPGAGSPVEINLSTQTPNGTTTAGSVSVDEGQVGSFRINAVGRLAAISGASVSQIAGAEGVALSNQDCAVSTMSNGSFSCVVGFTAPATVTNFTPYEFQVQATDTRGSVGATTVKLVVSPKNAGVISAGVSSASTLNNPIRFDPGTVRDLQCFSNGGVAPFEYRWTVTRPSGNQSAPEIQTAKTDDQGSRTSNLTLTLPNTEVAGVYTATCTVRDTNGQTATAPSVFFTLQRTGFFLEVSPGSQNEPFAGGDTISLRANILDLGRAPVGDPQNYRISFVPNTELASFGQRIGSGLNYDIITPRFNGSENRVFSVTTCASKTSDVPAGITNICEVERSAKLVYTFKVEPDPIRNQAATVADAELVGTSTVFAPGDTVRLSGAGTRAVNGANIEDVFYYWTLTPATQGVAFNNSRLRDPSITIPTGVTGSFRATLFTSLQNTNSATPPAPELRSEDSVTFSVNANSNIEVIADAGTYAPIRVGRNPFNVVLSGASTQVTNSTPSRTLNYEWFQITTGTVVADNVCRDRSSFIAFVEGNQAGLTSRVSLNGSRTVSPAFDVQSVSPAPVAPDQRLDLGFVLRANVSDANGELASDCATTQVRLIGEQLVSVDAGQAQSIVAPAGSPTVFQLDGTRTTIDGVAVSPNGDAPAGYMVSWNLVEARNPAGNLITPTVNINNRTRFNASVILTTPGVYIFDLVVATGQERRPNGNTYDLTDPLERIDFGTDFPTRRQTVSKSLSNPAP